mmetsp:Transcript_102096/g.324398  ORF Transcript_102096/g.324398 Transcript_102096/m.324398 type:complete len:214 (+) Transcript_102096:682-1323(+)
MAIPPHPELQKLQHGVDVSSGPRMLWEVLSSTPPPEQGGVVRAPFQHVLRIPVGWRAASTSGEGGGLGHLGAVGGDELRASSVLLPDLQVGQQLAAAPADLHVVLGPRDGHVDLDLSEGTLPSGQLERDVVQPALVVARLLSAAEAQNDNEPAAAPRQAPVAVSVRVFRGRQPPELLADAPHLETDATLHNVVAAGSRQVRMHKGHLEERRTF